MSSTHHRYHRRCPPAQYLNPSTSKHERSSAARVGRKQATRAVYDAHPKRWVPADGQHRRAKLRLACGPVRAFYFTQTTAAVELACYSGECMLSASGLVVHSGTAVVPFLRGPNCSRFRA